MSDLPTPTEYPGEFRPSTDWPKRFERWLTIDQLEFEYTRDRHNRDTIWLWATQTRDGQPVENHGDHVYVGSTNPATKSQGFGGSSIRFDLVLGGQFTLKGPWHSNSDSLFQATRIDVRRRHYTRGVVALDANQKRTTFSKIVHLDQDWTLGEFERVKKRAKELAWAYGQRVHFYVESWGGSMTSWEDPPTPMEIVYGG